MHDSDEKDDDAALFREAIGAVKRLPQTDAPPVKPRPTPRARMAERDEADARGEFQRGLDQWGSHSMTLVQSGDIVSYRRDKLPARLMQRLRRGQFSVQDELDLHGASVQQAETLLRAFLAEAQAHEFGCVRIIHGKGGRGGSDVPILKNLVDRLLRHRNDVLAFHSAPPTQGGTGAVLVLLSHR